MVNSYQKHVFGTLSLTDNLRSKFSVLQKRSGHYDFPWVFVSENQVPASAKGLQTLFVICVQLRL